MKDRSFRISLALIAVALWALLLRPLWEPVTAQAQADKTGHATYEYSIIITNDLDKLEKNMNEWGKEGWRAAGVAINPQNGFARPQTLLLLEKRSE